MPVTRQSTSETHALVRLVVVQLTCHPALKIGDHDYLAQPYVPDDLFPPLSRVSRIGLGFDIEDLAKTCAVEYLQWSEVRLKGVLDWLHEPVSHGPPSIVVFPEGSIPREHLKLLTGFARETGAVIVAGTHTFSSSDQAAKDYYNANFIPQHKEDPADPPEVLETFLERLSSQTQKIDFSGLEASDREELSALLNLLEWIIDDGFVRESKPPKDDLEALKSRLCRVDPPRILRLYQIMKELRRLTQTEKKVESLSIMPLIVPDARQGETPTVMLRPKLSLSPFERVGLDPSRASESDRPEPIEITLGDTKLRILPTVCSEALHHRPENNTDLVVILSYDESFETFDPVIKWNRGMRIPTVYVNDGRYGSSMVGLSWDNRMNTWWPQSPNEGALPPGDAILILDTALGATPESGTTDPKPTSRLVSLAAVVPQNERDSSYRVARALNELRRRASARANTFDDETEGDDVNDKLLALIEKENPTETQFRNLNYLYELSRDPNTASAGQWNVHANDCMFIDRFPRGRTLHKLEERLTHDCYSRLGALLDRPDINGKQAAELVSIRRECATHFRLGDHNSVVTAVLDEIGKVGREAHAEARKNLTHRLGSLVERFGASAGWLFTRVEPISPSGQKSSLWEALSGSDESNKDWRPWRLISTVVHNSERGEVEIVPHDGISDYVARTKRGYLCNRAVDEFHRPLDPYYRRETPSSRATLGVPICAHHILNPTSADDPDTRLIGVLTLEANEAGVFSPGSSPESVMPTEGL